MKKRIACIVSVVFILIAFGATVTVDWLYDTFMFKQKSRRFSKMD